jgi:hypothetical protein
MNKLITLLTLTIVFFSACTESTPEPPLITEGPQSVLISNEGNFGTGQGTLSIYDRKNKAVEHKVFEGVNSEVLGNVFQSIALIDELYYLVVNNSQKIVVCDLEFNKVGEITGFTSPREILAVGDSKAYVTDLFANKVWIVDLATQQITGSIEMNGWTEHMVLSKQICYVNAVSAQRIYLVNTQSDAITDSIVLQQDGQGLLADGQENLWVLTSGWSADTSRIYQYDLNTNSVLDSVLLQGAASQLTYNSVDDVLYFVNGGIRQLDANTSLVVTDLVDNSFDAPYKLGFDARYEELYLSDVHDYQQSSSIYRFSTSGSLLDDFKGGIIAGDFYFPN